jgi:hypothetical protein
MRLNPLGELADLKRDLGIPLSLDADPDKNAWSHIRKGAAAPVSSVGKVVCVLTPPTDATPIYTDRERCIAALANWNKLAKLYADRKMPKTCAGPVIAEMISL